MLKGINVALRPVKKNELDKLLLLGRNTYDIFAASFANAEPGNPATDKLNQARKYVVTSRGDDLAWQNTIKVNGDDIAEEVARLKHTDGPLLQVHGSWQLVQALLKNSLIDELRLWTFPVIVGSGKRLFADGALPSAYKLIKFEPCSSGA